MNLAVLPGLLSTSDGMQSISIQKVYQASSNEWDAIWQDCDYATYYHSREWAEIWSEYTQGGLLPDPKVIVFSDSKKALLPLLVATKFRGLIKTYLSSIDGGFGGWISCDRLTITHAQQLADFLTKKLSGSLFWRLNPYEPLMSELAISIHQEDYTQAINLEKNFTTLGNKQISAVHKAQKSGVLVTKAATLEEWKEYYAVYQSSVRRWGEKALSDYKWELFENIFRRHSVNITLWLAQYEHKVVSGAVCLSAKQHVLYWHGAALKEYFHLRPVNLLMYEIMKDCYQRGYTWFDFFASAGNEGVIAFKRNQGASPLRSPLVQTDAPPLQRFLDKYLETLRDVVRQFIKH